MLGSLAFPLLVTVSVAAVATSAHRRLPPRLATRFVTIALVLVILAALPTALVVAVAFLAHAPVVGFGFEWCAQAMGLHGSVPAWLGAPVVVLIAVGAVRAFRLLRQHRALRVEHTRPIHVAHSHKPYAVTLPGRAGQIVISTAMVELLDEDEQRIVVAHERAHDPEVVVPGFDGGDVDAGGLDEVRSRPSSRQRCCHRCGLWRSG